MPKKLPSPKKTPSPKKRSSPARRKKSPKRTPLWILGAQVFCVFLFVGGLFYLWLIKDLPSLDDPALFQVRQRSLTFLDAEGKPFARRGETSGKPLKYSEVPPFLRQAILSTEDRNFFTHSGVNLPSIFRAMWMNLTAGKIRQGGSTITQQLAKNLLITSNKTTTYNRSYFRKMRELLLARRLESVFSKQQLFTLYVNRAYFGSGIYGLREAAQRYFSKPIHKLNHAESLILAGLFKAPTAYAPTHNLQKSKIRARVVLASLKNQEKVSTQQERNISHELDRLRRPPHHFKMEDHFVDWVQARLKTIVDMNTLKGDLVIETTLSPRLQRIVAREGVLGFMSLRGKAPVKQLGMILIDQNGAVRAMIGGVDYETSKYNRVTQAMRQPGSVYKIIPFMAALESGKTPRSKISDKRVRIGHWSPKNYGWRSRGEVSLEEAFSYSINTATVNLSRKVGVKQLKLTAKKLGLSTKGPFDLTRVLGSGETNLFRLTNAYNHISQEGKASNAYGIVRIRNSKGEIVFQRPPKKGTPTFAPKTYQDMKTLLQKVMEKGTGRRCRLQTSLLQGGKTGTTQDSRDAYFIGYTPLYTLGVWVGNDDNKSMGRVTGASLPGKVWQHVMGQLGQPAPSRR